MQAVSLKLQLISGNFENIFNKMEKRREKKGDLFYALFEQKYEINATCQIRANRFISGRRMKKKKLNYRTAFTHTTLTENKNFEYFSFLFGVPYFHRGCQRQLVKGERKGRNKAID